MTIRGEIIQCALIHLQMDQSTTVEIERHRAAGAQGHRSQVRGDNALVAHPIADQGDIAAVGGSDRALVHDAARAVAREALRAGA